MIAVLPPKDRTTAGTASINVFTQALGGGTSAPQTFTITAAVNPLPILTGVTPNTAQAGSSNVPITITGSNFVASSTIEFKGVALMTRFVSATTLTAVLPPNDLTTAGTASINVFTQAPGGGTSASQTFTVTAAVNPLPILTGVTPNSTPAGGSNVPITITGSNFVASSTIEFKGVALMTRFVSATTLTAVLPPNDLTTAGTASITVFTQAPGGGTSASQTFTITAKTKLPSLDFVIGTDSQVYTRLLDASGNPTGAYYQIANKQVLGLSVIRLGAGSNFRAFVVGTDHQVYAETISGATRSGYFATAPGASVSSITAGTDASGNPLLFLIGTDNQLYEQKFDASGQPVPNSFSKPTAGSFQSAILTHDAAGNPLL